MPYTFDPAGFSFFNVVNIFQRVNLIAPVMNNVNVYYQYDFKQSDSLETIAHKYYGDVNRFWILMLANNLMDVFYDLPLKDNQFANYLVNKYGLTSDVGNTTQIISRTRSTVDHYEKTMTNTTLAANGASTSNTTTAYYANNVYAIDGITSISTPVALPTILNPIVTISSTSTQIGGYFSRVMIYKGGLGYTSPPTLTISGTNTGGSNANAYPVLTNGIITSVVIDNPGSLYKDASITVTGGDGSGASLSPFIQQIMTVTSKVKLTAVSIYDTEDTKNEDKRRIDVIKKDFVPQIETELKSLL
jgi:hypothetical protein